MRERDGCATCTCKRVRGLLGRRGAYLTSSDMDQRYRKYAHSLQSILHAAWHVRPIGALHAANVSVFRPPVRLYACANTMHESCFVLLPLIAVVDPCRLNSTNFLKHSLLSPSNAPLKRLGQFGVGSRHVGVQVPLNVAPRYGSAPSFHLPPFLQIPIRQGVR
jgi:hypothetical protein